MADEENKEPQLKSNKTEDINEVDDSAIQQRLKDLEAELAEEIENDNKPFTTIDPTHEVLSPEVAEPSESLTDSQIEDQLAASDKTVRDYQLGQASKTSMLDNISASDLAIEDDVSDEEALECLNCAAQLKGPYCHNCGQPDRHFIRFFPKVLWDMINEAFDLDSRALRTLFPLMFNPGRLSMEYIAGRRARYVNPLRLYIILSVLFFISISIFTSSNNDFKVDKDEGVNTRVYTVGESAEDEINKQKEVLETLLEQKANGLPIPDDAIATIEQSIKELEENPSSASGLDAEFLDDEGKLNVVLDNGEKWDLETNQIQFFDALSEETTTELNQFLWSMALKLDKAIKNDPSDLIDEFFNAIPQLMFILLPLFAVLLKITYIFKKRYYMEHLIVALHSHCFIFFSLILLIIFSSINEALIEPEWLKDGLGYATIALSIWMPINIFITQKRIYAQGYILTGIKFIFVGIAYMMLLMLTSALAFVVGLASL
jgi:hypothetical protein